MIKVKDGYAKLIGTTYQGSATQVLLSNGGDLEYSASSKASTLVQRNASQHIYATYFNSAISDEALTDIGSVYVRNTSDTFIRRVSKTQFYSIIDNKFVTLDTAQTITGVKTFSTGPILANRATITQNQNSTSNYTTVVKWLKGGTSQGTYNPSIGQHNTGGDGTGSICILPYPTSTDPWGGTVGLFIGKGVLRLDGKAVAIAENYYTKTKSDERYVNVTGDTMTGPLIVKASITGTQLISNIADGTAPLKVTSKTVVTNLNSDLLDGYHETSFFRARGSQTIASSIPTTTELSSNNNLSGNWNVTYPGASGHLVQFNTGSGSTRYMQFYSYYSGSLYWRNSTDSTLNTKSWKTIVDSANYTGIVLKIGTATKGSATLPIYLNAGTPTACSTTLGVSITGNAATATKLQTARTINGTSFDGSANITTAYWGATRTITLSGAVTGSASVNGSQNVTITTTYQTGSIDGRYVGGKKIAGHGSRGTAYTADTYSSNFVNKAFVAYAERGSWAYANNGYITTDTGVNIPLAGTAIFQWGASDTNKTQLFITPMNNNGVSNPAVNEMLFYTSNGSEYSSGWSRVLTNRNYTIYTVTKTGGGASGTWGISITGNAAAVANALTFSAGKFSSKTYNGSSAITVNVPTHTSHLTNDSGFLTGNVIRAINANGYWGMARPDSNTSDWIRTTSSGIIPYQSGGRGAGHCGLGTSSWYFSSAYIDTVHGNLDGTATNADKLDGFHANTSQNPFGKIPIVASDGVMEVGRYLDFHYNSSDTSDYRTRLYINHSSGSYTAILPAKSGTLAMTSDIPTVTNYYWANVRVSSSSSTSTSPTFSTAYTSNWFRSTGSTGWYSQTYGGGWYMSDSTWIRTFGSKSVYQDTGQIRTDGYLVTNGGLTAGATSPNNETYKLHVTGASWSSGLIRAGGGFYHNSVNSNNYVLLAGGSYKNLADFAKGNAGSSTQGVYVTGGTVKAMTYKLNATVNSGSSGKLAYYSGTNSIDDYTSTKGSSSTPIYLNAGVPTACSGVIVKYWGWYNISCYSSTTPTYSKKGGNFNFVTSVSRRSEGKYTVGTVYPSGYTWDNTIYWGSGRLNKGMSSNSSNSVLYVTMFRGHQSGSTRYLYVNTADDFTSNDGVFDVFFLCF